IPYAGHCQMPTGTPAKGPQMLRIEKPNAKSPKPGKPSVPSVASVAPSQNCGSIRSRVQFTP
ncbi:MAG: hypothetical protein ACYST6_14105, partial [Planctomycetota bacterium]